KPLALQPLGACAIVAAPLKLCFRRAYPWRPAYPRTYERNPKLVRKSHMSIIEGLKRRVEEHPDKLASICGDARLTFRQVDERVNRFSNALARLGVSHGDRVAILSLNCHRFMEFYYAVPQLGAIVVPINFRLTASEIKYIVDHSGSKVLAVDSNM